MKYIKFIALVFTLGVLSCKSENNKKDTDIQTVSKTKKTFTITPETTTLKWTAYKTTARKPVSGKFTTLRFDKKTANSPKEVFNNLSFSIPVSSIFTDNESRDEKLKTFFFKLMLDTEFIKGDLVYENDICMAYITMNGMMNKAPMEISISEERRVQLKTTINLDNWAALKALSALNEVCFDLHKGDDGVSKTWEDVAIEINTYL